MNVSGYERLMRDHAYWAGRIQELKQEASRMVFYGTTCPHENDTCIGHAFKECGEMNREAGFYDGFTFEEVWEEMLAAGQVCDSCQEIRRLKAERMKASRRLGAVRAAITRVGRNLSNPEVA